MVCKCSLIHVSGRIVVGMHVVMNFLRDLSPLKSGIIRLKGVLPPSQNLRHISLVKSQYYLSLTKFIHENINIYNIEIDIL